MSMSNAGKVCVLARFQFGFFGVALRLTVAAASNRMDYDAMPDPALALSIVFNPSEAAGPIKSRFRLLSPAETPLKLST